MPSPDAAELLRTYASCDSECAFRTLVEHSLPLVHSTALRYTGGNTALAEEVAQDVFITLARKARALGSRSTLGPWLFRATHLAALHRVRSEQRRIEREQKTHIMEQRVIDSEEIDWVRTRPLLDRLLTELGQRDQEAIFLRFFEDLTFAEIGARLNVGEDGARQRSSRALEKLRARLSRRGIRSTAAVLAQALTTQYVGAAPAGLAASITTAALAGAITAGGTAAVPLIFLSMNVSKAAICTLSLFAIAGVGGTLYHAQRHEQAQALATALQHEQVILRTEAQELRNRLQKSVAKPTGSTAATPPAASAQGFGSPASAASQSAMAARGTTPPSSITTLLEQIDHVLAHPELRPAFVRQIVQQLWGEDQRFFVSSGVAAQQMDAIKEEAAAYASVLLDARAKRIGGENFAELFAAADDHSFAQVRRILGEDTFARLREYKASANENRLVDQLASRLYYTDTPLTGAHASQLAEILVKNRFSSDRADANQTVAGHTVSNAEHAAFRSAQTGPRVALITDAAIARVQALATLPTATVTALQTLQASQSAQLQLARSMPPAK